MGEREREEGGEKEYVLGRGYRNDVRCQLLLHHFIFCHIMLFHPYLTANRRVHEGG